MNAERTSSANDDDPPPVEGEYVGKHYDNDPEEAMEDLVNVMTRYMNENPRKTAIIVTASITAAITAALTAAIATAAVIWMGDRLAGPKD
jgi:hypothetical protein